MSTTKDSAQKARKLLSDPHGVKEIAAHVAQAHASLAIAEQLERLNDQLKEVIEPGRIDPGGRGFLEGYLRTEADDD